VEEEGKETIEKAGTHRGPPALNSSKEREKSRVAQDFRNDLMQVELMLSPARPFSNQREGNG
jgi:hypothetical protein